MIFATGDIHGDPTRFSTDSFPEQKEMTKDDYVIVLGDFGLVWNVGEESKTEKHWLDWLEKKPFTTLFVDGNHENYDRLNAYPVEEWHGGKVQKIRPSVIHLMRGEIYDIDGAKCFAFGGAPSHDIQGLATDAELAKNYAAGVIDPDDPDAMFKIKKLNQMERDGIFCPYRVRSLSWWPEELPSEEEMDNARKNLAALNHKVDYVFSHDGPSSSIALGWCGAFKPNKLTKFLEDVRSGLQYRAWLFGHYHEDRRVTEKEIVLYTQIVQVW